MPAQILIFNASKDSATSQPREAVKYRTAHTTLQQTLCTSWYLCKFPFTDAGSKGLQGIVAVWQETGFFVVVVFKKKAYLCYQTTETMALRDLKFPQKFYNKGRERQEPWCQAEKLFCSSDNLPDLLGQTEMEKRQEWIQEKRQERIHDGWGRASSRTA